MFWNCLKWVTSLLYQSLVQKRRLEPTHTQKNLNLNADQPTSTITTVTSLYNIFREREKTIRSHYLGDHKISVSTPSDSTLSQREKQNPPPADQQLGRQQ